MRQQVFAWVMNRLSARYEPLVAERKQELLRPLRGVVVELGPGTGPNLRYYAAGVRWIGVEPNPHMHSSLRQETRRQQVNGAVLSATAEHLPLPAGCADAVVSTLVLCSVADLGLVLREVRRVLKPGGCFLFVEHVGAPRGTLLRLVQRWGRSSWRFLADGCHWDRDTEPALRAGFAQVELERVRLPLGPLSPHIVGRATNGPPSGE